MQYCQASHGTETRISCAMSTLVTKWATLNWVNSSTIVSFQLAKYCDSVLKKSTKNLSDTELDERLGDMVSLTFCVVVYPL